MPMKRSTLLLWIIGGGGACIFLLLCLLALVYYFSTYGATGLSFSSNQIAVLDLEGTILDSRDFIDQLKDFGNRPGVRAVVVRINSPGGGVAASQEVYEAIKKFRADSNKKVVASFASVAASGGYYIACAADRIFANPGSVTGSIGVIAQWYNFGDLLQWARMQDIVIKTGELKDAGSPTRPLTESERQYFQSLIDSMLDQFVSAVAIGRNMKEEDVRKLADGRVFTGLQALENGLIDDLGTCQDAIDAAAHMAGISVEPGIVRPAGRSLSLLDLLLGDVKSVLSIKADRSESHVRFEYLWR